MAWIRIDDHFDEHPKLAKAGPLGWALWMAGLAYCNRNLTDGFIPWAIARRLVNWEFLGEDDGDPRGRKVYSVSITCGMAGDDVTNALVIDRLVDAGLWVEVDGGFQIHDYDQYQPSKEQVQAERAANAKRQADWKARRADGNKGGNSVSNAVSNGVNNRPLTSPPTPTPTPSKSPEGDTPLTPQGERNAYPADFEAFWSQYPKKEAKKAAMKAWVKLKPSPELVDEMMAVLAKQRASPDWNKDDGRFVPQPATWINGERWTDAQTVEVNPAFVPKPANTNGRVSLIEAFRNSRDRLEADDAGRRLGAGDRDDSGRMAVHDHSRGESGSDDDYLDASFRTLSR
jgi:hypothetical protein